jgi:hypothetical protein
LHCIDPEQAAGLREYSAAGQSHSLVVQNDENDPGPSNRTTSNIGKARSTRSAVQQEQQELQIAAAALDDDF